MSEDNADTRDSSRRRRKPPTLGLAISADFWLWGALLFYAPTYLAIGHGWQFLFFGLGALAIAISFASAVMQLGELWGSEGLEYWGVSLVILIPAAVLYFAVWRKLIRYPFVVPAKIAVLLLTALGGALFFQGVPYFFWESGVNNVEQLSTSDDTPEEDVTNHESSTGNLFKVIANVIIALLSLATAVVTLVSKLRPTP